MTNMTRYLHVLISQTEILILTSITQFRICGLSHLVTVVIPRARAAFIDFHKA